MDDDGRSYPQQDKDWDAIHNAARETLQSIRELEVVCSLLPSYIHHNLSDLLQASNEMLQVAERGTSKLEVAQPEPLLHVINDVQSMESSSYRPAIFLPVLQRQRTRKHSKVRTQTEISLIMTSPNLRLNKRKRHP